MGLTSSEWAVQAPPRKDINIAILQLKPARTHHSRNLPPPYTAPLHNFNTLPTLNMSLPPKPGPKPAPIAPKALVAFKNQLVPDHGLVLADYGNYEVPWHGGITVTNWLNNLQRQPPHLQKASVDEWMAALGAYFDKTTNIICATGEFLKTQPALMAEYGGTAAFEGRYAILKDINQYKKKRQQETINAFQAIDDKHGDFLKGYLLTTCHPVLFSHTSITSIRWLLDRFPVPYLAPFLNTAAYRRLNNPARRQDQYINATDWDQTATLLRALPLHVLAAYDEDIDGFVSTAKKYNVSRDMIVKKSVSLHPAAQSSQHRFWISTVKWYAAQKHLGTGLTNKESIPQDWLKEKHFCIDPTWNLLTATGPSVVEEAARFQNATGKDNSNILEQVNLRNAVNEAGTQSPNTPGTLASTAFVFNSPRGSGHRRQSSIVGGAQDQLIAEGRARARSGSVQSPGPGTPSEDARRQGNHQTDQQIKALQGLRDRLRLGNRSSANP